MYRIVDDEKIQNNIKRNKYLHDITYRDDLWKQDIASRLVKFIHNSNDTKMAVMIKLLKKYIEEYILTGKMTEERFSDIICVLSNENMVLTDWNIEMINMRIENGEFEEYLNEVRCQRFNKFNEKDLDWWL